MTPRTIVEEAFSEHRARVEAAAAHILRDADEAKDVAADTFIALLEHGPEHDGSTLAWLITSARNKARNRIRSKIRAERRARLVAPGEAATDPLPDDGGAARLVGEAAERLSPRDRAALLLRHVDEADYEHIADALETSPRQARVIVHRATRRLRREVVRIIAERHETPADCARDLIRAEGRRAHAGCDPCTAVLDEVQAMTASGLLPLGAIHAVERVVTRLAGSRPVRGSMVPGAERIGEIVAALAMTVTLAAGPAANVIDMPADGRADRGAVADLAAAPGATLTIPDPTDGIALDRSGQTGVVTRRDRLRDSGGPSWLNTMLGSAHVVLPDPLDRRYHRSVDITSLQVATLLDHRGRWDGIAFKIGTAGVPDPTASYTLDWSFADGECRGSAATHGDAASIQLACFDWSAVVIGVAERNRTIDLEHAYAEDGLVFILRRADMGAFRPMLVPGKVLTDIYATTASTDGFLTSSRDDAPDEGSFEYRVANGQDSRSDT